ncbi:MAG: VWA domain-containing protein [Phycisphaerales bacterium]|nr:MAG: VWA domain-containing protein [Phycisphaerales bacterium]
MSPHSGSDARDANAAGATAATVTEAPAAGQPGPSCRVSAEGPSAVAILLAWLISIIGHVSLFTVMFAVPWLSGMVRQPDDLPIARTELISQLQPQARLDPRPEFLSAVPAMRADALRMEPRKFEMMSQAPGTERFDLSIIGIGTGGGDLSRIGLRIGSGQSGPSFFGIGGKARQARRIVYVVDRSGSMLELLHGVKKELKRSIKALRRTQRFHVIFYNSGEPLENPPKKLISATSASKADAFRFIDEKVEAAGSTDPLMAIARAFAVKPDLVYFLSDGEIPMASQLLTLLEQVNEDRSVRVFTIAYVDPRGAELLEKIAREHRGEYRYVSEHDLLD